MATEAKQGEREWASEVQPGVVFTLKHEPDVPNLPWCLYLTGSPKWPELTFRAGASCNEEGAIRIVNLFLKSGVSFDGWTPAYSLEHQQKRKRG